jgi:hypothetical protein
MLMAGGPVPKKACILCDSVAAGAEPLFNRRVKRAMPAALHVNSSPGGILRGGAAAEFALRVESGPSCRRPPFCCCHLNRQARPHLSRTAAPVAAT